MCERDSMTEGLFALWDTLQNSNNKKVHFFFGKISSENITCKSFFGWGGIGYWHYYWARGGLFQQQVTLISGREMEPHLFKY